jgi:hypothetical protein
VLHESLSRAWSVQKRAVPIIPSLYFSPDGLAFGAGTILLPAVAPRCLANLQGEEARLLALLSATFGKAISPSVLGSIDRAAKSWSKGDDATAAINLAHAGLPRPDDPDEAARRLFVTDAFIKSGTSPIGILQALGLEASYVGTVAKLYNELEPRVPAGNGIISGRWTRFLSFLGELTGTQATQFGLWATRLLGPAAVATGAVEVFRTIFVPADNPIRDEGDIKGLPGGHYSWNRDETQLRIDYRTADGEQRRFIAQRNEDKFIGPHGEVVGIVLPSGHVSIDGDALPGRLEDDEPKLCPRPEKDRRTNDKGLAYEAYMRPIVNPDTPTPLGMAYYLPNSSSGKAVEFDDCQQTTGIMIDYKDRYWKMLSDLGIQQFLIAQLWKQAGEQVAAAGDRPVRWYFSEEKAADYIRDLFHGDPIRGRIEIVHVPMPESER